MFEALVVLAILALLVTAALLPPLTLLWFGAALGSLGALVGVPAGLIYHARLWRALQAHGLETGGFWLRPHRLHDKLPDDERQIVRVWFAVGALGFAATVFGAVGVVAGVLRYLAL